MLSSTNNFADGTPRVKHVVIFRGKGLRIKSKEQDAWDRRVQVLFQEKSWCDEPIVLDLDFSKLE